MASAGEALALTSVRTTSGCSVRLAWTKQQTELVTATWLGSCESGLASGLGKLVLSAPGSGSVEDAGRMDGGVKVGQWIEHRLIKLAESDELFVYTVTVTYRKGIFVDEALREIPKNAPPKLIEVLKRDYSNSQSNGVQQAETATSNTQTMTTSAESPTGCNSTRPPPSDFAGNKRYCECYPGQTFRTKQKGWYCEKGGGMLYGCTWNDGQWSCSAR